MRARQPERTLPTLKPAPLRKGDLIGVVAPAAAVDAVVVESGVRLLEEAGYRVVVGGSAFKRNGYLAGSDDERLADLADMFTHPEVRAIICTRGGYGAGRLLPHIDLDLIRRHPKIFVGHSDITFLLTDFVQRAGLVTFHGPMMVSLAQQPGAVQPLVSMLRGERSAWKLAAREVLQPGMGEGVVIGGCLSAVVAMLGTPYEVDTAGRLLFLEDVNEKPFRIDRMLTQLRQAGKLKRAAGVIFGEMVGCTADPYEAVTVRDVIAETFANAPYPVAFGLPSGHGEGAMTVPLGVRARLAGERLTLLEAPLLQ